uniref:Pentraxin (PTX) domain-containing protein n=1 Tax=Sinocyclocheilus anshuiensis TaxID=1608454 RepID=A0A671N721_9TELE
MSILFLRMNLLKIICPPDIYMLEFPMRPHRKSARLRHKFPNMEALTVCAHLQLDPTCQGLSTVFSYAIQSSIKEFQLQAQITGNEPVHLALLVHGSNTSYITGFPNDASWHFVCASWDGNTGKWVIWVDGAVVGSGNSLNSTSHIGGDGLFMIGQDQETYGGYNNDKALCGNVTQLYMWDRFLVKSEIQSMEKLYQLVISGLDPSLHHNLSINSNKTCVAFDPASGKPVNSLCTTHRGSVCLFPKGDHLLYDILKL